METKVGITVNKDQKIVTTFTVIETPEEYLLRNGAVYNFSEEMKPGAGLSKPQKILEQSSTDSED